MNIQQAPTEEDVDLTAVYLYGYERGLAAGKRHMTMVIQALEDMLGWESLAPHAIQEQARAVLNVAKEPRGQG